MDKVYQNEHVRFELSNGIVKGTFLKGPVTLDVTKMIVNERLNFSDGNTYPIIIIAAGIGSIKSEARKYLSSEKAKREFLHWQYWRNQALPSIWQFFFYVFLLIKRTFLYVYFQMKTKL